MKTLENQLRQGQIFTFENEDTVSIEISFGKSLGGQDLFKIWMNGKFIKMTKTFKAINKKLEDLKEMFNLELIEL